MGRIKIVPDITYGNLLTAVSVLLMASSLYFGLKADNAKEASVRQLADTELSAQIGANARQIAENIEAIRDLNGWRSTHQSEWDRHRGNDGGK